MRTSSVTVAVLALATVGTYASANDDLNALLADLSFGGVESAGQPLARVEENKAEELRPVPTGFSNPGMVEGLSSTQIVVAEPISLSDMPMPEPPRVSLQHPIPEAEADLDTMFSMQDTGLSDPPVPARSVGFSNPPCFKHALEQEVICRPHVRPNLPTSTLLQYMSTHPCYSNVWDGYRFPCGAHHKHLHGECDCFKAKHSGCESCDGTAGR